MGRIKLRPGSHHHPVAPNRRNNRYQPVVLEQVEAGRATKPYEFIGFGAMDVPEKRARIWAPGIHGHAQEHLGKLKYTCVYPAY